MIIEIEGSIGIAATKLKAFFYKRKGYYVGERFVKPKRIKRFRRVPLKKPYIYFTNISLKAHEKLKLGGTYKDQSDIMWRCTQISSEGFFNKNPISTLTPCKLYVEGVFNIPNKLLIVSEPFPQ